MERGELDKGLAEEIRARVLGEGFMKIVQTVRRNGTTFRISMRPVMIGGERRFQAEMTDDGQTRVKNFDANGAAEGLEEIIGQKGARDLHLMTARGDLHVRVTRKGRVMATRSAEMDRVAKVLPHDHVKKTPLSSFDSATLLRVIGLADGDGKIRASMRGKYDQVNEFLKVVEDVVRGECEERAKSGEAGAEGKDFTIVDCGCGKAYLTLALYFFLAQKLKFPKVRVIGVDRREDVIAAARKMARQLDVSDQVQFVAAELSAFDIRHPALGRQPSRVDMTISLHACDTATDEALAKGVEWKSRYIISAPCCQHELQKTLGRTGADTSAFAGVLRHGILRERLCDILTDSFRAMILRILGFKTQVVEFVSPDATARNILLRAEYCVKPGQGGAVSDYLNLRDWWRVTPWLETRLSGMLEKHLSRY
ncbi:MAG: SAM-dependent methyltransferase [Kiritimatiellae bacterium]|nr:SAM-dependent methyltransferase [Kiritimatiellia bacterium]